MRWDALCAPWSEERAVMEKYKREDLSSEFSPLSSTIQYLLLQLKILHQTPLATMAITEFLLPTLKQEADTIAAFPSTLAPFLNDLLDKSEPGTGPKQRAFGKLLLENGKDVSSDFRPCLGFGLVTSSLLQISSYLLPRFPYSLR